MHMVADKYWLDWLNWTHSQRKIGNRNSALYYHSLRSVLLRDASVLSPDNSVRVWPTEHLSGYANKQLSQHSQRKSFNLFSPENTSSSYCEDGGGEELPGQTLGPSSGVSLRNTTALAHHRKGQASYDPLPSLHHPARQPRSLQYDNDFM